MRPQGPAEGVRGRRRASRRLRSWLAGWAWGALLGVVVVALAHLGYLERYDLAWLDSLVAISPPGGGESHVKIVAATDEDFRSLGIWPPPGIFPRRLLAQSVLRLSASRVPVVCLDVQLDLPTDDDAVLERALAVARQRGTDVVVAMSPRASPPTWPLPRFASDCTPASADLLLGPHGEVRAVAAVTETARGPVPAMAAAAREALRRRGVVRGAAETGEFPILFHQDRHPIARYGLVDLLTNRVPPEWLQTSAVFIGRQDTLGSDAHRVPVPASAMRSHEWLREMPGVEVQANALATVLDRRPMVHTSVAADLTIEVLVAGGVAWLVHALGAGLGSAVSFSVVLLGGGALSAVVFGTTGYVVTFVPTLLAVSAHAWIGGWSERRHLHRALGYLMDEKVLRHLGRLPEMEVGGGAIRHLAILTFDIRGSTRLIAQLPPGQVDDLINLTLATAGRGVIDHCGIVNKFLGDGLLALFMSDFGCPDPARAAMDAAREVHRRLQRNVAPEWDTTVGHDLHWVLSVHCGSAWVGFVGLPQRLEFTALGDAVDVAFELQAKAKGLNYALLASEDVVREAGLAEDPELVRRTVRLSKHEVYVRCFALLDRAAAGPPRAPDADAPEV